MLKQHRKRKAKHIAIADRQIANYYLKKQSLRVSLLPVGKRSAFINIAGD